MKHFLVLLLIAVVPVVNVYVAVALWDPALAALLLQVLVASYFSLKEQLVTALQGARSAVRGWYLR